MSALASLFNQAQTAHDRFVSAFKAAYPPGSAIKFRNRAGNVVDGEVYQHGYDGRVYVTNLMTGSRYWITYRGVML